MKKREEGAEPMFLNDKARRDFITQHFSALQRELSKLEARKLQSKGGDEWDMDEPAIIHDLSPAGVKLTKEVQAALVDYRLVEMLNAEVATRGAERGDYGKINEINRLCDALLTIVQNTHLKPEAQEVLRQQLERLQNALEASK